SNLAVEGERFSGRAAGRFELGGFLSGHFEVTMNKGVLDGEVTQLASPFGNLEGLTVHLADLGGKTLATIGGSLDLHALVLQVLGRVKLQHRPADKEPLAFVGEGLRAADSFLSKYFQVKHLSFAGGDLAAEIAVIPGAISKEIGGKLF